MEASGARERFEQEHPGRDWWFQQSDLHAVRGAARNGDRATMAVLGGREGLTGPAHW